MHASRCLPALLALSATTSLAGTGGCDRPALYARLTSAEALTAAPAAGSGSPPSSPRGRTVRLKLVDNPLVMDGFKYDAVVDITTGQAWLLQFGGFGGGVRRMGPVSVALETVQDCPEVRAALQAPSAPPRDEARAEAAPQPASGQTP